MFEAATREGVITTRITGHEGKTMNSPSRENECSGSCDCSTDGLKVFRFDDSLIRSHVMADSENEAVKILDRTMGREDREPDDVECDIYRICGETVLPISLDGGEFTNKTAAEWMTEHEYTPGLL